MSHDVRRTSKGRGVFARYTICKGDTIEVCHMIVSDTKHDAPHPFDVWDYEFGGKSAIALGNGSLYNHSYTPNASWVCRQKSQTIRIYAIDTIVIGREILINYVDGYGPEANIDLGFKVQRTRR